QETLSSPGHHLLAWLRSLGPRWVVGAGRPRFYLLSRSPSEIFGFYLRTELGHPGHVIRQLEAGGPAQRQGLKDGDRLLQVNGEDVDRAPWQVVQKIKASGTRVSVTVLDGSTYKVAKTLGRDVGAMLPGIARPRLCYITKDKSGFGFSVSAPEGVKGTFRLSVVHDGPADRAGVPDGSWLLELNGASVKNCSYAQLSRKLKQSGGQVTLLVLDAADEELCRRRGLRVTAAMADASRLPFRVRKLHMVKGPKGYGFLLQEEAGIQGQPGQFLREVDVGLPAERAGMREGDRLLAVNGKSVEELDHQQIVLLIRASGPQVTLLVIDAQGNAFFNAVRLSPLLFYEDQDAASGAHASSPGLPHTPCHNPHAGGPQDITTQVIAPDRGSSRTVPSPAPPGPSESVDAQGSLQPSRACCAPGRPPPRSSTSQMRASAWQRSYMGSWSVPPCPQSAPPVTWHGSCPHCPPRPGAYPGAS
uniref:NHERF family PDZ scaffold protein 4 n=1 Tax=Crocodylus porosus TaxID=8502 RepID=A0A7M4E7M3_CROPO